MLLVIEILLLIAGIIALATGKLPSFLLGGAKYRYEGRGVRWLGLILVLPLPLAFVSGVLLALLFGDQATGYTFVVELLIVLAVIIAVLIVSRYVRQPVAPLTSDGQPNVEPIIAKKAQGSLIYALLGILGFSAIVVCPLAFIRANQALRLIDEHQVGEQYRGTAKAARIIAPVIFLFYAGIAVLLLILITSGL